MCSEIDGDSFKSIGFIPTGAGAHGLAFSRDSRWMYVSNRREGSVSTIDVRTRQVTAKWMIPGGGSPDMGGVSPDGKILWLSGRYNAEVYAFDTADGHLLARIPVGKGPHGLLRLPATGPLFARPHRQHAVARSVHGAVKPAQLLRKREHMRRRSCFPA